MNELIPDELVPDNIIAESLADEIRKNFNVQAECILIHYSDTSQSLSGNIWAVYVGKDPFDISIKIFNNKFVVDNRIHSVSKGETDQNSVEYKSDLLACSIMWGTSTNKSSQEFDIFDPTSVQKIMEVVKVLIDEGVEEEFHGPVDP